MDQFARIGERFKSSIRLTAINSLLTNSRELANGKFMTLKSDYIYDVIVIGSREKQTVCRCLFFLI